MIQRLVIGHGKLLLVTASLTACFAATSGHAQTGQQTLSASGQTFGGMERELEVNVGADVKYDSNVLGSQTATEALRGVEREDVILRPRIDARVSMPLGPVQFAADGSLGYDFYTRNTELDSERIALNASAMAGAANCGLTVNGGYSRGQNSLRDLSIEPGDPVASSVNVQTVSRVGATATCGAVVGLRGMGFVEYRMSRNSNERRRYSNINSFTYGGGVQYSSPLIGEITAFIGQSEFEYTEPDPVLMLVYPDVNVLSGGLRLDRRLGARLQVNAQVTYVEVEVDGVGGKQYDGINWDVAATVRASDQLQLTLGTARQIDASNGFSSNFVETSSYSAGVDYVFTPKLNLNLGASHQKRNFDFSTLPLGPLALREDKFNEINARLNFQMNRRLSLSLFGSYEDRDADLDIYDYDAFTAGVGARLQL